MLVTGVQSVGAKGVTAIQGTVVDPKESTRATAADQGSRATGTPAKPGEPQPIVFPRAGMGVDQRPVALRHHDAVQRYRAYGGKPGGDHDEAA